jgi:uncharacterized CHY-type Zn-finger protein
MKNPKLDETKNTDSVICPWCAKKFDADWNSGFDIYTTDVTCPYCRNEMNIGLSITYTATPIDDNGNVVYAERVTDIE